MLTDIITDSIATEELVRLSFFSEIARSIVSCRTVNDTLSEIMRQIGSIFSPLNWSLMLRDSKTGELKFIIVEGRASSHLKGKTIKKGQGIAGWIAENKMSLIIEDVEKDGRFDSSYDEDSGFKTESIIGVPLISRGKVYGVIELINKLEGTRFTPFDLKLLTTITDFAAIAIEKAYYHAGIKKLVNIDPLTKVYNRRYFQFYLTKEIERTKRSDDTLTLMFIDIDDFKLINDTYGHVAGDKVLMLTAAVLKESIRSSDLVFRYGGDEFILLLPSTGADKAHLLKERIFKKIELSDELQSFRTSLSIGVHEAQGEDYEDLLNFVDQKMYMEKLYNKESSIEDLAENITIEFEAENKE
ncbi:MAG: sensor domain-containing diguanylate cyclase [Spirochaetales bacterium]|nr:sensor domain-containing diguanylate cyclase [Spirochaetales bacterium]